MSGLKGSKTRDETYVNDIVLTLSKQRQLLESQLLAKSEQIKKIQQAVEGLQQALDQSQQLHAMSDNDTNPNQLRLKGARSCKG